MTGSTGTGARATRTDPGLAPDPALDSAPDLETVPVGEGLLLFDPVRVRAHALNGSAALVWRTVVAAASEAGTPDPRAWPGDADAITTRITEELHRGSTVAPPADEIRAQVVEVLRQLAHEGLLAADDDRGAPAGRAVGFANVPFTDEVAPALDDVVWAHRSGPYRGVDVTFRLDCDDADLGAYLARALAPLRVPGHPTGDADAGTTTAETGGSERHYQVLVGGDLANDEGTRSGPAPVPPASRHLIALDGHVVARPTSERALAGLVLWHVNQLVSETSSQWLVHASATLPSGAAAAVVFPAHMNSGKSTLVAALVAEGHGYVTDETVAVDLGTGEVVPYPKAIGLDPGSWPLLPQFAPDIPEPQHRFAHDKWYCDVERLHPGASVRVPVPVGALVFPAFEPSHPTTLTPLSALEAAVELAQNSFNLLAVGREGLAVLGRLAETCPAYRLSMRDLPSALDALGPVLAALPARPGPG